MDINNNLFNLIKEQKFNEVIDILNKNDDIDINIRDNNNSYLIQYAILYNNIELVLLLIKLDCKLDFIDADGYSILYIPIKYSYNKLLELLITNNNIIGIPLVDIVDKYGSLAIHYIFYFDNIDAFNIIFKYNNQFNKLDNKGMAPIHYAIKKKKYDTIEQLISSKAVNINLQTNIGETPLHIACNYEDEKIVSMLLLKKTLNIDIIDYEHQITPLMYVISLNNISLTKLLLNNKANPEIQDSLGNTSLHLAIIENNVEITNILINKFNNFNLSNIECMTPLHQLLVLNTDLFKINEFNIDLLLIKTNINIQDINGNTIWHLLATNNLWTSFKNILINKKNNIFIKNSNNITPFEIMKKNKNFDMLIDIIIQSYYNILITQQNDYINDWENNCANKKENYKFCKEKIKENILKNNTSVPLKTRLYNIEIELGENTIFTTFTGVPLDILSGLLMVHQYSTNKIMSTLNNSDIVKNDGLAKYYLQFGIQQNTIDFLNFEIIWLYQTIYYPTNFDILIEKFKSLKDINFFIIPLGIKLDNMDVGHSNILIYDRKKNTLERFEPHGYDMPVGLNYNDKLLDIVLHTYFKTFFKDLIYLSPKIYLPKIGFQIFENIEHIKKRKLGDPGGFCATWCLWYVYYRVKYADMQSNKLVEVLIKKIKYNNFSFKDIIRNFSKMITDYRDNILNKINSDINKYINNQFTNKDLEQIDKIVKSIV